MMRAAILLGAALAAGCGAIGTREADRYFLLEAAAPATPIASRRDVRALPTTAASFYDTQSIAFSREAGTRAYYQFNHWTERPQRAIHAQLAARFPADDGKARLLLETHLDEIYHDAATPPGAARISLTAALVDRSTRATIARRAFSRAVPAPSHDAPGAVRALNEALGAVLGDIETWSDGVAASAPAR